MFRKYTTNLQENTRAVAWFQWCCSNFIEIAFRYACSPVNLLHIFRTPFPKNIFGRLLLPLIKFKKCPQVIHILTFWFIFSLRKCMLTIKMQCQEYKLPGLLILSSENKLFFVTYLFVSLFIYTFLSNIFTFWEFGQSRQKIHKCVFIFLIYIS